MGRWNDPGNFARNVMKMEMKYPCLPMNLSERAGSLLIWA